MMIRALLRKQLRELGAAFLRSSKTGKARSRASAMGYALLFAVLVVVLMLCFAGMALPLASVLLPAGLDWLYFASMGLTALLVSVLASAFTSYSGLFQSRDNELLLSLPIPPAVIFGVRVSTVYLACLIYLLMAWVPAVVCYGLLAAHPLAGVLLGLFYGLFLYQKWSGHSIQFVSNKTGKTTDITLYLRAIVARLADVVIINLLIQTKLNLHYGFIPQEAYGAAIVARVAKNVIELAIDLPLLFILLPVALKAYQHIFRRSVSPKVAG